MIDAGERLTMDRCDIGFEFGFGFGFASNGLLVRHFSMVFRL
jgi:hypothetical protein